MDTFYINGIGFLGMIGHPVQYRTSVDLEDGESETIYNSLDKTLRTYNGGGFRIKQINCDGEFKSIMDKVKDELNVKMNYTNAGDHVPEAERNNRTIKERFRTALHRTPYKRIPKLMIKELVTRPVLHRGSGRASYQTHRPPAMQRVRE